MATVYPHFSTISIQKEFQVDLFWKFQAGEPMRAAPLEGMMEITIDPSIAGGDWIVSDLWVCADNQRMGKEARGGLINLDGDTDEHFMLLVMDAIDHQYATRIEGWVQDELSSYRYTSSAA